MEARARLAASGLALIARAKRRPDTLFYVAVAAISLGTWWRFRSLPYDWDAASFVVEAARDLGATHFDPFVATHSDFAHPPLFVGLLAAAWALFGDERVVSHALEVPFFAAGTAATYILGCRVHGRLLGAAAALLFAATPVVQEEYAQVYVDLPTAALVACGLACWACGRVAAAGVCFCLAAAVKIPSLMVPLALGAFVVARPEERRDLRRYVALGAPFVLVVAWLLYHRAVTGWLLSRPGRARPYPGDVLTALRDLAFVAQTLFVEQWRALLLVAGAAGTARVVFVRRDARSLARLAPLAATVAASVVFFVAMGEFGARYGIFALPALYVVLLYPARVAFRQAWPFGAAVVVALVAFVAAWHPSPPLTAGYVFRPDDDLRVLDVIAIGRRAAQYVRKHYPNARVYGSFPESYQLTEPWQGYVDAPLSFAECSLFAPDPAVDQLVYVHGYSPGQLACETLVRAVGARGLMRFESGSKWLELWEVPRPSFVP